MALNLSNDNLNDISCEPVASPFYKDDNLSFKDLNNGELDKKRLNNQFNQQSTKKENEITKEEKKPEVIK